MTSRPLQLHDSLDPFTPPHPGRVLDIVLVTSPVVDPEFLRWGGANLWAWGENLLFDKIITKNCMKMKEIGPKGCICMPSVLLGSTNVVLLNSVQSNIDITDSVAVQRTPAHLSSKFLLIMTLVHSLKFCKSF